mgnify:CR=1 FL=1
MLEKNQEKEKEELKDKRLLQKIKHNQDKRLT